MRSLGRLALVGAVALAAAAAVPACAADTPPSLIVALHTNDLAIAGDTNLVGLYINQLASDGRVLHTDAYEAAPLRLPNGKVEVPFPASLVLVRGEGETVRVHARFVAYRADTRVPLTMRESRTELPQTDAEQRLLRLNLFFTNQGNVVDTTPNDVSAVATFDRFVSLCDGAPAPQNQTSGDDGRCVALDVPLQSLPIHELGAPLSGATRGDTCFDVAHTFAPGGDVARLAPSALVSQTDGTCTLSVSGVKSVASTNVALVTTDAAFETPDYDGLSLRPLPSNVAFTVSEGTLRFAPNTCRALGAETVRTLLVSSRTRAWTSDAPVCAPWVVADAPEDADAAAGPPLGSSSSSSSSSSGSGASSSSGSTSSSSSSGGDDDEDGGSEDASGPADAKADALEQSELDAPVQALCGDGIIEQEETCDDGNNLDGDGCSLDCEVQPGWTCPTPGEPCQTLA